MSNNGRARYWVSPLREHHDYPSGMLYMIDYEKGTVVVSFKDRTVSEDVLLVELPLDHVNIFQMSDMLSADGKLIIEGAHVQLSNGADSIRGIILTVNNESVRHRLALTDGRRKWLFHPLVEDEFNYESEYAVEITPEVIEKVNLTVLGYS